MGVDWNEIALSNILGKSGYIRGPFGSALRRNELHSTGVPVYEQQHAIYNNRIFRYFIDNEKHRKLSRFTVKENDLIVSCSGTLGKISIICKDDPEGIISQALLILRPNTQLVLPKFLFYFFFSPIGYHSLVSVSSGSVQVNIAKRSIIESIKIKLPPLLEQKAIVHILGTLDDKIELNRRMNNSLEEIARAIFKKTFLGPTEGGLPPEWTAGSLGEKFNITMGQSPPGSTYNEIGEGMPFYQGRTDFGFRFPTRRVYCTEPTRFAETGDTLVSVRAPVGSLNMTEEKCCIGRGVAAIRHKSDSRSYTYYLMHSIAEKFERFEAEGTVFGSIGKTDFEQIECICPPEQVINGFEVLVFPIDQRIEVNEKQSRNLAALRDTLLPKLLSGEIRIKDAEEFLKERGL